MKYLKMIIGMMALLFCTNSVFAQKAERKNIREGNKLYQDEKYTESEIAYRKGIDVNPRSSEGAFNLGNALYKQDKLEEAAEQYQLVAGQAQKMMETEKGKQQLSEVFHNTGNIFMKGKDYAKSIEAYKQSLRLDPRNDETRYNLALAQKLLEDQEGEDQGQDQENEEQEENQDQQQDQQDQPKDQNEDKPQEEEQPNEQISQDNAQQILDAFLQDEKDTQEKVKKAQQEQQQRRRTDKEW